MSHDLNGTAPKAVKRTSEDLLREVDELNEGVKALALNLAIYLAKAKEQSADLSRLEPDFVKLVNGTVKVVQELTDNVRKLLEGNKVDILQGTGRLVAEDQVEVLK